MFHVFWACSLKTSLSLARHSLPRHRARLHVSREVFPDWDFTRYAQGIWLRFKVQQKGLYEKKPKKACLCCSREMGWMWGVGGPACRPVWIKCRCVETAHWSRMLAIRNREIAATTCLQQQPPLCEPASHIPEPLETLHHTHTVG